MKDKVCISVTNSNLLNHQREVVVLRTKASRLADSITLLLAYLKKHQRKNDTAEFSD